MKHRMPPLLTALFGAAALSLAMPVMADDDHDEHRGRGHGHYKHPHKHRHDEREQVVIRHVPVVYEHRVVYERPYYAYRSDPTVIIDLPAIVIPMR